MFKTTRRNVLKGTAPLSGAIAGGAIFAPSGRAAKTIKLGYVSPQIGPLAACGEADDFVILSCCAFSPPASASAAH